MNLEVNLLKWTYYYDMNLETSELCPWLTTMFPSLYRYFQVNSDVSNLIRVCKLIIEFQSKLCFQVNY